MLVGSEKGVPCPFIGSQKCVPHPFIGSQKGVPYPLLGSQKCVPYQNYYGTRFSDPRRSYQILRS